MLGDFEVFGFTGHNWMLAVAALFIAYIVVLLLARSRQRPPPLL